MNTFRNPYRIRFDVIANDKMKASLQRIDEARNKTKELVGTFVLDDLALVLSCLQDAICVTVAASVSSSNPNKAIYDINIFSSIKSVPETAIDQIRDFVNEWLKKNTATEIATINIHYCLMEEFEDIFNEKSPIVAIMHQTIFSNPSLWAPVKPYMKKVQPYKSDSNSFFIIYFNNDN